MKILSKAITEKFQKHRLHKYIKAGSYGYEANVYILEKKSQTKTRKAFLNDFSQL